MRRAAGGWHGQRGRVGAVGLGSRAGAAAPRRRAACPRTGTLARAVAAGPGLDAGADRAGAGPRGAHHRRLAGDVSPAGAGRPGVRRDRRSPPALDAAELAEVKAAVAAPPRAAGIDAATWSAKVTRQFLAAKYALKRSTRTSLRVLHRLGLVWKRPKRLLLKADAAKRAAFVEQYRTAVAEMERRRGRLFFVDEALFRADGDLRGLWVPKGEEALVPSSSPGRGEKVNYYGGVCLETGDVIGGEFTGNSTAAMSVAFLEGLRAQYAGPLTVIWDNGPAHHGPELREYLQNPDLDLSLLALP